MTAAVALPMRARETMLDERLIQQLREVAAVRTAEPLARHTTFGIGGPADIFATVRSADALASVWRIAKAAAAPCFILGSGSNILVGDAGVRGVVIDNQAKQTRTEPLRLDPSGPIVAPPSITDAGTASVVWVESGASFAALARRMAREGLGGIEWASGIPGSIGGGVVYNAGAYGGCMADVLLAVTIVGATGEEQYVPAAGLRMAYRTSAILRGELGDCVVLSAELAARPGDAAQLTARVAEIDVARLGAQPRGRTGGSTFKNPEGHHAWELIDGVGLRGERIGDAQISEKHCNFFMNTGAATAADVYALMREAMRRVKAQYGIDLQNEVELVGEGFA